MTTTTILLPPAHEARMIRAAERAGTTLHELIVEAITEKVEQEESHDDFADTADRRYARLVTSGKAVPWSDMRRYMERRLTRKKAARPKPRALARQRSMHLRLA